jgi:signal transduction histidine kinase
LSDAQLAIVDEVHALCSDQSINKTATHAISAMARADKEDAIGDWLRSHNITDEYAGPLSETEVTIPMLDMLASHVGPALDTTMQWLSAGCVVRTLSDEIETAASRIHELVGAVKSFSYMDHAPTPEPVDIRRGISDTLTMLGAKVRAKEAEVSLIFADDLPRVHAVGAELNQVWMNLIDNALDAIAARGHLTVSAGAELDRVIVRVVDDGPGIPVEIQGRIFDPFFTTKGVGKGTGLGLDIVRRLLQRHEGEIALESAPGRTEFQVRLALEK